MAAEIQQRDRQRPSTMETVQRESEPIKTRLGLFDTSCIIVGIIIGVGIFETPAKIFQSTTSSWMALGVWVVAGILSLVGALCFAELAAAYPRSGGEYVYLSRAYGRGMGFLFGWAQLMVIRSGGGIALVAYIFGKYAALLFQLHEGLAFVLAILAIAFLTLLNILGVKFGKTTQNLLTVAKVAGILVIVFVGFLWGNPQAAHVFTSGGGQADLALAMILVFYTFDGWNEATYVAAEVRDEKRNLPRALILGTLAVTMIYLVVNGALLWALGFETLHAPNSDPWYALFALWGPAWQQYGMTFLTCIIMISSLGSINGMIFASSRIYSELGKDHRAFAPLSRWNRVLGTPMRSLIVQGMISGAMILGVGYVFWIRPDIDSFDAILASTSPVFWLFFLLTGLSVIVLRRKEPNQERPFRVPFYPILPLLFSGWCGFMLAASIQYLYREYHLYVALGGIGVVFAGWLLYLLTRDRSVTRPASLNAFSVESYDESVTVSK